jgi:GWxTD domain-containing protein
MQKLASGFAVLVLAGGLPQAPRQTDPGLIVRAVRFFRPDQERTRVKALVQIPYTILRPAENSARGGGYTSSVRVSDSTGLTLFRQAWNSRVSDAGAQDAYTVEIDDFMVAPGKYRLDVAVQDSISGHSARDGAEFRALSDSDAASDLLIAPQIRQASPDDTVPRLGEFRTGNNLVTAVAQVRLTPTRPSVYYLLEAYADSATPGTMSVAIRDSARAVLVQTPPVAVTVNHGGSVLKGQLDLSGLPEGRYTMVASLKQGTRVIERSAEFTMAGLSETLEREAVRTQANKVTDEGYFNAMTLPQLDSAKAPLIYLADAGELSAWSNGLSLSAKRRLLSEFWQKRDPTPDTPVNERREQFYQAIAYANRSYREGGRKTVPGWRSDRGRIYARLGGPDEVLDRPNQGRAPRYIVWRYTRARGNFYIFADRTGFGAYQLIYSDDLREPGQPDWDRTLGRDAVGDVSQFLNIDLFAAIRKQDLTPRQRF